MKKQCVIRGVRAPCLHNVSTSRAASASQQHRVCASVQATRLLGHRRTHLCGPRGEAVARGGDPAQRRSELSVSPKVGDQLGVIRLVAHAGARQVTPRQERRVASDFSMAPVAHHPTTSTNPVNSYIRQFFDLYSSVEHSTR